MSPALETIGATGQENKSKCRSGRGTELLEKACSYLKPSDQNTRILTETY